MATSKSTLPSDSREDQDSRYSPEQAHYDREFNDMSKHYNENADSSDENSNIDRLRDQENNPNTTSQADGKSLGDEEQEAGAKAPVDILEGRGRLARAGNALGSKRGLFAAGGITAILLAIGVSFLALLPLKIISLIEGVTDKFSLRVEDVVENRAQRMLARAILGDKLVITGGGVFNSLVAGYRTSNFEKRMAANHNLVITREGDGVKLTTRDGLPIGVGGTLKNESAIIAAIESGQNVDNDLLKKLVREDISALRWHKRAKFVKFMRIKYNIPRFGTTEKDDDTRTPQENSSEDYKEHLIIQSELQIDDAIDTINQAAGEGNDPDSAATVSAEAQAAGDELRAELDKVDTTSGVSGKISSEISTLMAKFLGVTIATKSIDTLLKTSGGALFLATLEDVLFNAGENETFAKLPAIYKAKQYARIYGTWTANADQIKSGRMSPDLAGMFAQQMDGYTPPEGETEVIADPNGAETSQTFNYINGDPATGIAMTEEQKVNDDAENWANDVAVGYSESAGGQALHTLLAPLRAVNEGIGEIIGTITEFLGINDLIANVIEPLTDALINMLGLNVINPADNGAKLYNAIGAGSDVGFNNYCLEDLGCRELSSVAAARQNRLAEKSNREYEASKGTMAKLFDTESRSSVISQVAMSVPSTGLSSLTSVGSVISGVFGSAGSTMSGLATGSVSATEKDYSYQNLYGVTPYGATDADLEQEISEAAMNGDCPDSEGRDGSNFDVCLADLAVAESMICAFKNDVSDIECDGVSGSGTVTENPVTGIPTGTAQELATQILANPNIAFQVPVQRTYMETIASTGRASQCGAPAVSPEILGVLLAIADKYKIVVGVLVDGHNCDGGFHPRGAAADINGINPLNGDGSGTGTRITQDNYNNNALLREAYVEIANIISAAGGGNMGQSDCFSSPRPSVTGIVGVDFFSGDSCNHLHIDTGENGPSENGNAF